MLEPADPIGIDNQVIDQIVPTTLPNCSLDWTRGIDVHPRFCRTENMLDICGGRAPAAIPSMMYLLMTASFASSSRIRLAEGRPKSISSPEKLTSGTLTALCLAIFYLHCFRACRLPTRFPLPWLAAQEFPHDQGRDARSTAQAQCGRAAGNGRN